MQNPEVLQAIDRIASLPQRLAAAVQGLSDAQLDTPYREGGWTVRQVVHHVPDSHMNAYIRCKLVVTEDLPILKPYQQNDWAVMADSLAYPIATSITLLAAVHERWVVFLHSLPDSALERHGIHLENGKMRLDGIIKAYADHGDNHLKQITDLKTRKGW